MKDAVHGESQLMVVAIYGSWVLSSVGGSDFLNGGEQRLDGFVSERQQGGDRAQPGRDGLVTTRRADALHDCLPRSFFRSYAAWRGP